MPKNKQEKCDNSANPPEWRKEGRRESVQNPVDLANKNIKIWDIWLNLDFI